MIRTRLLGYLGLTSLVQSVENGEVKTLRPLSRALANLGAPGRLVVEERNAAVLIKDGVVTNIVSYGTFWLRPFEHVAMPVFLGLRQDILNARDLMTKDRVIVESIELRYSYRIDPDIQPNQSPSRDTKRSIVWKQYNRNMTGIELRSEVRALADAALRDVIAGYDLQEVMPLRAEMREELSWELHEILEKRTKLVLGIELGFVYLGAIVVPAEIRQGLHNLFITGIHEKQAKVQAEIEKRLIETKGGGQALAIQQIEKIKYQFRDSFMRQVLGFLHEASETSIRDPEVAIRFLEMLEKMDKNFGRVLADVPESTYGQEVSSSNKSEPIKMLEQKEQALLRLSTTLPETLPEERETILAQVSGYLKTCEELSDQISVPEERHWLRATISFWASIMSQIGGGFYYLALKPSLALIASSQSSGEKVSPQDTQILPTFRDIAA